VRHLAARPLSYWCQLSPIADSPWRRVGPNGVPPRQAPSYGAYIVDFVCFERQLVVELDGPQHFEPEALEYDARRTAWLTGEGYRVIRYRNHEVDEDVLMVVERIRTALQEAIRTPLPSPLPNPPHQGEGTGRGNR
jgi:hypothetical protein